MTDDRAATNSRLAIGALSQFRLQRARLRKTQRHANAALYQPPFRQHNTMVAKHIAVNLKACTERMTLKDIP
jgi:hypothetical protein